ncbi:MAG TPA: hypothetical protein PKO33_05000 [Pyrinomonadaceae bacterium]|nr:hypothetical protein [Pyrinomonadaceae bacterium]
MTLEIEDLDERALPVAPRTDEIEPFENAPALFEVNVVVRHQLDLEAFGPPFDAALVVRDGPQTDEEQAFER